MKLKAIYPRGRRFQADGLDIDHPIKLSLHPFEVIVFELQKAEWWAADLCRRWSRR